MRALIVGDIHLADRPPSIRTDDYAAQILAKLEFTVELAEDRGVDCVIWAGDVFHVKAPTRTSHALVRSVAELGQSYGVPWLIVPGNHDMRHDRLDTLDRQPLGVLFKAGAISLVGEAESNVDIHPRGGAFKVFGIPWLYDWAHDLPTYVEEWQTSDAELMVTHAPIVKPGDTRPYDVIDAADWAAAMIRRGAVYFGHMHEADGAFQVDEFTFCNQGALSRGSVHEMTLSRKPAVTIYDSEELYQRKFLRVEVPHLPAREVFLLAEKDNEEMRTDRLDEFLSGIGETRLDSVSIEAVREHVRGLGLQPAVEREVADCLEVALHA
jgi:DNA repair exonuclease SbcCD nuclease subunit